MCGPERYASLIPNKLELRIIALVGQGLKNSEIAQAIGTTEFVVMSRTIFAPSTISWALESC
jgi:hypothetical protein